MWIGLCDPSRHTFGVTRRSSSPSCTYAAERERGYQYEVTPRSFARFASFWSKVAMASYRWVVATAMIDASARAARGFAQSSKTRRHGQVSIVCTPVVVTTSRITEASRSPAMPYWLCSSSSAASRCLAMRSTKKETRTFASTTTVRTSDASSGFPRFVHSLHRVVRAVLDEAFPPPESRSFSGDGDAPAVDLPRDLVAGANVEGVADFLRHGRLSLAGDRRARHRRASLQRLSWVRSYAKKRARRAMRPLRRSSPRGIRRPGCGLRRPLRRLRGLRRRLPRGRFGRRPPAASQRTAHVGDVRSQVRGLRLFRQTLRQGIPRQRLGAGDVPRGHRAVPDELRHGLELVRQRIVRIRVAHEVSHLVRGHAVV